MKVNREKPSKNVMSVDDTIFDTFRRSNARILRGDMKREHAKKNPLVIRITPGRKAKAK